MPAPVRRSSRSVAAAPAAPVGPQRRVSTSRIAKAVSNTIVDEVEREKENVESRPTGAPKKRGRKKGSQAGATAEATSPLTSADEAEGSAASSSMAPPPKKKATRKTKSKQEAAPKSSPDDVSGENSIQVEDEPELDSDGEPVRRAKNGRRLPKKKSKVPKTYVIPDVIKRDFRQEYRPESTDQWSSQAARANGFVGRLGYACLNTVLRTADPPVFSSRTARIKSIDEKGLDWVKELARANVKDIIPMIQWNAENNIRFMRLSSEIFPFASHAKYGYSPDCAAEELAEAGRVARSLNHRLTMHPGQFVQLGSPNPAVVEASIRELDVHATVLDLMGMDQDSVMIIHGGGVYGNRAGTLERMKETIRTKLPTHVRNRLVLENDEISWSAEELLPVCHEFKIPMVFDFHHDMLRPSKKSPGELMPELLQLFSDREIKPKFHLSHPRPGSRNLRERRAHSDRCCSLPLDLPPDADLMIEAKDKEQAVLELYRVYDLYPVKHDILRPPADDITTATSGRRKVLNGSGGATATASEDERGDADADADEGDDSMTTPKKKKAAAPKKTAKRETEDDKVRRSIEHSKKIAAKRGIPYTGPEYSDPGTATQRRLEESGPILNTPETILVMEREANAIREELRRSENGRAVSEIREEVEGHVVDASSVVGSGGAGSDNAPSVVGGVGTANGAQGAPRTAVPVNGNVVPPAEQVQDPVQREVPGEEEKPPYEPVTPVKRPNAHGEPVTVVIPTSAENVDRLV